MAGAGYRNWTAGDVPTATQFDTFLQEQTVMRFADAAARDTALSVAKAEGMFTYQVDSNMYTVYDGVAWLPFMIGWAAYTPTIGGAGWGLGNGTITGRYNQLGKTVTAAMRLTAGTTTTFGASQLTMTLPVTASTSQRYIGHVIPQNVDGAQTFVGVALTAGSTTVALYSITSSIGQIGSLVQNSPFTYGTTDLIDVQITYEAA